MVICHALKLGIAPLIVNKIGCSIEDLMSQTGMSDVKLLTVAEVAARCQVSLQTVYQAIHTGRLRAVNLGEKKAFRIHPEELEKWIRNNKEQNTNTNIIL